MTIGERSGAGEGVTAGGGRERAGGESERRLRELFDGVDAIIASLDEDGRVVYNARLQDILGYDPHALPGHFDWEQLVHPDDAAACDAVWRSDAATWEMEYRIRRADGAWVWVRDRGRRERNAPSRELTALFCVITDITEVREARAAREAAVRGQEQVFRDLIERQDAITWMSESAGGPNLYMSPQVEAILGYPAERWREPGFWQTTVHPDDRERVKANTFEAGRVNELEYRAVAADGGIVWFRERITVRREPDGREFRYGLAMDITALKAAEAELRESERRLAEIVEGLDAAIGFGRQDADSIVVSGRIRDILGYEPEELRHYGHWDALIHPDDLVECQAVWGSAASTWSMEYRMAHRDGHWVWVRDRARRVFPDGTLERIYFVITDVTRAREAEEELRLLERRTAELAKLEALARVAATTAHDFGNVLVGIDVFAKALERNALLDDRGRRDVAQIRQAVATGRTATASLISLGNLQDAILSEVEAHALITSFAPALIGLLGPEVALTLRLEATRTAVEVDPAALERAIINLVVNAKDALPDGGTVTVATSVVEEDESTRTAAAIALPGTYLSIAVRDDGSGMDEETLGKAFEPYFTTKPVGKGTGLGLSSVHAVAHAVDGHVHAESRPGAGSTFRICLPLY